MGLKLKNLWCREKNVTFIEYLLYVRQYSKGLKEVFSVSRNNPIEEVLPFSILLMRKPWQRKSFAPGLPGSGRAWVETQALWLWSTSSQPQSHGCKMQQVSASPTELPSFSSELLQQAWRHLSKHSIGLPNQHLLLSSQHPERPPQGHRPESLEA